ncbi:MAG: 50S ribosomal protein L23 [Melioribacteraceae bacterium]|jgi:large subunit ribosomal protein L23|nr:50S ribosomal protein L23 [Ignavibacteriota bacterium]MBZ0183880.1 50S ribosomal protein L23 [Melioribacteraceae bacterium]
MVNVLIKPLITEKMTDVSEKTGKYGFVVDINANKIQIASAIKQKFNVDVVTVNTIKYKGKTKTQFTKKGRFTGRTKQFKKAIVTLKEGQTIDLFGEV